VDYAIAVMRAAGLRGAHAGAAKHADGLSPKLRTARMRQGRMTLAAAALSAADLTVATAGERLLLAVEAGRCGSIGTARFVRRWPKRRLLWREPPVRRPLTSWRRGSWRHGPC